MAISSETIQADFDRIALLSASEWNHDGLYHDYLISHLSYCENTLEIGCGAGQFSRRLAKVSRRVVALDLSPEMIRIARDRSRDCPNIDYQLGDVMTVDFGDQQFDCIASIATLHHLPFAEILRKAKSLLKPGGILLVLDLDQPSGVLDILRNLAALPVSLGSRLVRSGRLRPHRELRAAWDEHGQHDSYLTVSEVRATCADLLPGAKIQKHLLWRYSLVWRKQATE